MEKPYQKPRPSSINILRTLFRRMEFIPSLGRPNEITTPKMINKIHNIVLNDPKVKVREIALCKMGAAIV